eukprot:CAMPEP_0171496704 /NCGR_PEP_ID=MMETSP0958-20121227/6854_1 /TAXON_ID=87120 /ORGANISM="Aurantiochytrium limacinum, Strain ATCCMYA-1381" /LENGTH=842 /DNA_ID=CAMNT_0012030845 /DNA_START=294 /DNA_END=2822 /DNA_ORIENTATION=-
MARRSARSKRTNTGRKCVPKNERLNTAKAKIKCLILDELNGDETDVKDITVKLIPIRVKSSRVGKSSRSKQEQKCRLVFTYKRKKVLRSMTEVRTYMEDKIKQNAKNEGQKRPNSKTISKKSRSKNGSGYTTGTTRKKNKKVKEEVDDQDVESQSDDEGEDENEDEDEDEDDDEEDKHVKKKARKTKALKSNKKEELLSEDEEEDEEKENVGDNSNKDDIDEDEDDDNDDDDDDDNSDEESTNSKSDDEESVSEGEEDTAEQEKEAASGDEQEEMEKEEEEEVEDDTLPSKPRPKKRSGKKCKAKPESEWNSRHSEEKRKATARKRLLKACEAAGVEEDAVEDWEITFENKIDRDSSGNQIIRHRVVFVTESGKRFRSIPAVRRYFESLQEESQEESAESEEEEDDEDKSEKDSDDEDEGEEDEDETDEERKSDSPKDTVPEVRSRHPEHVRVEQTLQKLRSSLEENNLNPELIKKWTIEFETKSDKKPNGDVVLRQRAVYVRSSGRRLRSIPMVIKFFQNGGADIEASEKKMKRSSESKRNIIDSPSKSSDTPSSPCTDQASPEDSQTFDSKKSAPVVPKLSKWMQTKIIQAKDRKDCSNVKEFLEEGYTVFPSVLQEKDLELMLNGPPEEGLEARNRHMFMRQRKGNQQWMGAIRTIKACIKNFGLAGETVLSPLVTREPGRYDMPLPREACFTVEKQLKESGLNDFIKFLCKGAKLRTQDIMLSAPGSVDQRVHTDSSWSGRKDENPRTHYVTILIPLTTQTKDTGGTRVWPRSHRHSAPPDWDSFIDMVEPILKRGDALIFDGLLSHFGQRNISKENRFFYYAAFANCHDPNTDVTGA